MTQGLKKTAWIGGGILAVLAALAAALLLFANTAAGRRTIAWAAPRLTGGEVRLSGLSGRLPDRPRIAHLTIADEKGVWLAIDDAAIDWSPLALIVNKVDVEKLSARHVSVLRKPIPEAESTSRSTTHIHVGALTLERVDLARAVAGHAASVTLSGEVDYTAIDDMRLHIAARRLDAPGTYAVDAVITPDGIAGTASLHEPAGGLIGGLAGLTDLGPLVLEARAGGPRSAQRISVSLTAGALRAGAQGTVDLNTRRAQLRIAAHAPTMAPGPDLSWDSLSLAGTLSGSFTKPDIAIHLVLNGLKAGSGGIAAVRADVTGHGGGVQARARVTGLRFQGLPPDVFGSTPLTATAALRLDAPTLPVSLTLSHPLLRAKASLTLAGGPAGRAEVTLPALAPFTALAGIALPGRATLEAHLTSQGNRHDVTLGGTIAATGSSAPAALIGSHGRLAFAGMFDGGDITIRRAAFTGAGLTMTAQGGRQAGMLSLDWTLRLADLARVAGTLAGDLTLHGTLSGKTGDLAATIDGSGHVAGGGGAKGPIRIAARLTGLPDAAQGTLSLTGSLNGGAVNLRAELAQRQSGITQIRLARAAWKSIQASAALSLRRGQAIPAGTATLHVGQLGDLTPFLGTSLSGALEATAKLNGTAAQINLAARDIAAAGARLGGLVLKGTVARQKATWDSALQLDATGLAVQGVGGDLHLAARGPADALMLNLSGRLTDAQANPARIAATATVNATARQVALTGFRADYRGQTARLEAPAHFDLAQGVAVDRLALSAAGARAVLTGRLTPALDASFTAGNVTPRLIGLFLPGFLDQGRLSAQTHLTGTPAAPLGTVSLKGSGLRLHNTGASVPAATLAADATLNGNTAAVHVGLNAGTFLALTVAGTAPLSPQGAIAMAAKGSMNLALLNPFLNARGRNIRGTAQIDGSVAGTVAMPRVTGQAALSGGDFQDYTQGVHLADISAVIAAHDNALTLSNLKARAGQGSISAQGTVDLWGPGMPADITLTARNAHILASNELSITADADLKLSGRMRRRMALSGRLRIRQGEVDLPDQLPRNVAVLDVRYPGRETAAPPPSLAPVIAMDLTVSSPGRLFVRGHGLDAEVSGRLQVRGTSTHPDVTGGFDLRRGDFTLAGQTMTFSSGRVRFDGSGPAGTLDPALDFTAQSISGSVTAILNVSGYASRPVIKLSSTPALPQDEVLAHLLFQQSTKQLGPLQMAEIAEALGSLTGVTGTINPLSEVRKTLGLDRLNVSSAGEAGTGASVEAGKYLTNGVYVGAKQTTTGQTQAQVQIDLTRHLKAETTITTGNAASVTGSAAQTDQGSSVGLSYQFDY